VTDAEVTLSEFVAGCRPEALPPAIRARVQQHLLDAIACAMAGRRSEGTAELAAIVDAIFGPGDSVVIADRPRGPAGAVLLNGFQVAAPTLGDVHRATLTHVMPEVLPAALAAAQLHERSGADLVAGIAAGLEVAVRVAEALDTPVYRARAFHNPGIAGAVGAACAAARTAGLDDRDTRVAIGHAVSQAAGTFGALGTSGVKLHQARGGLTGFLAAELARTGLDASERGLTAERGGLLAAYADGGKPARLVTGLGESFALEAVALRRWPGASSLQPVIEATLEARTARRQDHGPDGGLDGLAGARVELPPRAFAMHATAGWATRLSALQSVRWTVAVVLQDGDAWLDQTSAERLADTLVSDFAARAVEVTENVGLGPTAARVGIVDGTGREWVHQVDVPVGDPHRPLSDADIRAKLDRAAASAGLQDRVPDIVAAVEGLTAAPDVIALTARLGR
jgi:2-methylcitrate dehydratase PrpD